MFSFAILIQDGAFQAIRQSLPTDPAALFALVLCALAVVAVMIGGRNKGKGSDRGGDA